MYVCSVTQSSMQSQKREVEWIKSGERIQESQACWIDCVKDAVEMEEFV